MPLLSMGFFLMSTLNVDHDLFCNIIIWKKDKALKAKDKQIATKNAALKQKDCQIQPMGQAFFYLISSCPWTSPYPFAVFPIFA